MKSCSQRSLFPSAVNVIHRYGTICFFHDGLSLLGARIPLTKTPAGYSPSAHAPRFCAIVFAALPDIGCKFHVAIFHVAWIFSKRRIHASLNDTRPCRG